MHSLMTAEEAGKAKSFRCFMAALQFLKCYPEEDVRSALFDMDKNTLRDFSWHYVEMIASLKQFKIVWPNHWDETFIITVDGTHCPVNEPRDPNVRKNPKHFSHKFKLPGVNYEIALAIWDNKCVHAKTQDEASVNDLTAFRAELKGKIPAGKRVVADRAYISKDVAEIVSVPNSLDSDEVKQFKSEARSRHETFNARLKAYNCLTHKFRHGVVKHQVCFFAVLVMVQYAIEDTGVDGEPLNTL